MLFVLTCLLGAVRPLPAQDIPSPEARRAETVRLVLKHGESRFAPLPVGAPPPPAWAHLMLDSAGRASYAEGSLEYAAAVLMSGGEVDRAVDILQVVLGAQVSGGKCPGAFPWRPNTDPDPYATAYLAPWLAYIHLHLSDRLPEPTRSQLADSLRPALGAVGRFSVGPDDPQALLTKAAAQAMLGAALNDGQAKAKAAQDLAAWLKRISQEGFRTAQNPTATALTVASLHWIWLAEPSPEARQDAGAALEYLYRDLALRYQPKAGMVGGAVIGGTWGDYAAGTGPTRYLLYAQFGRPALTLAEPFAMFLAVPGFTPNEETLKLARAIDVPRTISVRTPTHTLTTHLQPRFALGTMSGPVEEGTSPVVLTYGPEGKPGAYLTVTPLPARVSAVQSDGRALVNLDIDNVGFEDDRLFVYAELHLGLKSSLDAVLLNQAPYTQDFGVAVETRANVVTEGGGVYTAIIPIIMGPSDTKSYDEPVGPAQLAWVPVGDGSDSELVLKMTARSIRGREKPRANYRIGFAIEMASREDYPSGDFAATIYDKRRVKQETTAKRLKVGEKTEDSHRPTDMTRRPTERGNWIYETRVVQDMTFLGEDFSLELIDDLEQNLVRGRLVNGVEVPWDFLYRSPALNQIAGDGLSTVLRPAPPPVGGASAPTVRG